MWRIKQIRWALAALDVTCALALAFTWALAVPSPALAYVDPSVMTYTIQALAGVAVAISAVIGVTWRRLRRYLMKALKIDEKREVEQDVHRLGVGTMHNFVAPPSSRLELDVVSKQPAPQTSWFRRFVHLLIPSLALSLSIVFFAPLEMLLGGESQLAFRAVDVLPLMLAFACLCGLVLALVVSLFRGKAYVVIFSLLSACVIGVFLQSLLLNGGLPEATGISVTWPAFRHKMLLDLVFWFVLIALCVWLSFKFLTLSRVVGLFVCVLLVVVQAVSLGTGVIAANQSQAIKRVQRMTEEGLFTVSPKKNTVVFILDTFDTQDILRLQAADGHTLDPFKGFTLYKNSSGMMIPTRYAIPFLLSNETPQHDDDFSTWYASVYRRSSFLSDIRDAGYSVGVYSDDGSVAHLDEIAGYTINVHESGGASINPGRTIKILTKCGIYKSSPWIAKPFFWFYQDQLNENVLSDDGGGPSNTPYVENDAAYYSKLCQLRLTADDKGENGAFRFIHLLGAHAPYILDANGNNVGTSNIDDQCRASLKMVEEYIQQLKELGVFDNTNIIVTADHGRWDFVSGSRPFDPNALGYSGLINDGRDLGRASCPLWLIKPAQSAKQDAADCKISDLETGHCDYAATVIDSVGGDAGKYGTPTWDVTPGSRRRPYYELIHDAGTKIDHEIQEYMIEGNALDFDSWHKTGRTWPINPLR